MSINRHKQEELIIFNLFRKAYTLMPKVEIEISESPDFLIYTSKRNKIGIEITTVIFEQNPKVNPHVFLNSIHKKEGKIQLYQKHILQEIWLIIGFESPSNLFTSNLFSSLKSTFKFTQFQKVFIFELFDKKLLELTNFSFY